jgi:dihydrofolate synthase/folylpolyglutamate synthase
MNYQDAIDFLYENMPMFHRIGAAAFKPDLSNSIELSNFLGKPEKNLKCIHVAGTNGKGSVSHLLSAVFQSAGFKVGLYTSPHYQDFRERIKINGNFIEEEAVIEFVKKTTEFVKLQQPSFFELCVGMAFDYFYQNNVDIAIIEVGMGGRLDATNIIQPLCSVITNIGFDHEQFLGNTLPLIAHEKAGIIKQNTAVIVGERHSETDKVFTEQAGNKNADLTFASEKYELNIISENLNLKVIDIYKNGNLFLQNLELPLTGEYQLANLKTVLATLECKNLNIFNINENSIREGIKNVKKLSRIIGRWDLIQKENPIIIGDSAHNEHGFQYLKKNLSKINYKNLHVVLGVVTDKSPDKILPLIPKNAHFYFCKANLPRAISPEILLKSAVKLSLNGNAYNSVALALETALNIAEEKDLILICGSIFVLGEAYDFFSNAHCK